MRNTPEHQKLRDERSSAVAAHRKIHARKVDHVADLKSSKPPATDSDGFKDHAKAVAAASEACRLTGREDLADVLAHASHKLWYLSL